MRHRVELARYKKRKKRSSSIILARPPSFLGVENSQKGAEEWIYIPFGSVPRFSRILWIRNGRLGQLAKWRNHDAVLARGQRRTQRIMDKREEVAGKRHRAESNPRSRSKRTVTKHQTRLGIEGSFSGLFPRPAIKETWRDLARVHKGYLSSFLVEKKNKIWKARDYAANDRVFFRLGKVNSTRFI